jgi:hypothetical protein
LLSYLFNLVLVVRSILNSTSCWSSSRSGSLFISLEHSLILIRYLTYNTENTLLIILDGIIDIWELLWHVLNSVLGNICRSWKDLRVNCWVDWLTQANFEHDIAVSRFEYEFWFSSSTSIFSLSNWRLRSSLIQVFFNWGNSLNEASLKRLFGTWV